MPLPKRRDCSRTLRLAKTSHWRTLAIFYLHKRESSCVTWCTEKETVRNISPAGTPHTKWWIVVLSDNLPEQPDWQTTTSRMAIVYSQRTCLTYDWAWRRIGVHQPLKPFTLKRSFLSVLLWPKTNTSPNQLPCQLMLQRDWLAVIYNRYYWLDFIRGFTGGQHRVCEKWEKGSDGAASSEEEKEARRRMLVRKPRLEYFHDAFFTCMLKMQITSKTFELRRTMLRYSCSLKAQSLGRRETR